MHAMCVILNTMKHRFISIGMLMILCISCCIAQTVQDNALCGLIAATNIATKFEYDEWTCTTDGLTSTNPCEILNLWNGISSCTNGYAGTVVLQSAGLIGKLFAVCCLLFVVCCCLFILF